MDHRIQQVLDGDLAPEDLTAPEQSTLAEAEAMIDGVLRSVPNRPLPDLGHAVLAQVARNGHRSRRWHPAWSLAAAATIAAVFFWSRTQAPVLSPQSATAQVLVQFKLDAPQAQQVSLAGDFTKWQPAYSLKRSNNGVWTIVVPLNPGVHDYAFVVDGERWVPDPMAPAIADGFGGMNSRLAILAPDNARSM